MISNDILLLGDKVRCEKCGNKIKELFIKVEGRFLCRKCLMYRDNSCVIKKTNGIGDYHLEYELTKSQKAASEFLLKNAMLKQNCVLSAVTGAGKTEIIYPTIKYCINNHLKIAIAIARKDVVIELYQRIKKDFKLAKVGAIYGGHHHDLSMDVAILTTHQLYRFVNYYDVVIVDEVDAFPFYNNSLLNNFLLRSVKGSVIYMSATVPIELIKSGYPVLYLNQRYHNEKLDIPIIKSKCSFYALKKQITLLNKGILIIYFPTIKIQMKFHSKFKEKHYLINSKTPNREDLLKELHSKENAIILSTLVLERGVTFKNTNVIVFNADHELFTRENLIQIAGRVGRHYLYPHGTILFLLRRVDKKVKSAIKFIKKCNE